MKHTVSYKVTAEHNLVSADENWLRDAVEEHRIYWLESNFEEEWAEANEKIDYPEDSITNLRHGNGLMTSSLEIKFGNRESAIPAALLMMWLDEEIFNDPEVVELSWLRIEMTQGELRC